MSDPRAGAPSELDAVALFKSSRFNLAWPKEAPVETSEPWGEDCASFIAVGLRDAGWTVAPLYSGEEGWYVDIEHDQLRFSLFVQWVPIGTPPEDYWSVQIRERRGIFGRILGRPSPYTRVRQDLDSLLRERGAIANLRWMSLDQFSAMA